MHQTTRHGSAASINGDDAIELFFNGAVVDLFGDIDTDGTGQPWEYLDGWAARNAAVTAPSATFTLAEWTFSGRNALDGETTNAGASTPIPSLSGSGGGTMPTPTPTPTPTPVPPTMQLISAIQGTPTTQGSNMFGDTDVSPLIDTTVTITGIVIGDFQDGDSDTLRNLNGFFVQEESADEDGDPLSSEGIFVLDRSFGVDVNLGDTVSVSGTVGQNFGETRIDTITAVSVVTAGSASSLSAVSVAQIDLASLTDADVTESQSDDFQADLEAFEGMLVTFTGTLTISEQFQLARFNEIRLVVGARPVQFTQRNTPSVSAYTAHLRTVGRSQIVYDDGLNVQNAGISLYGPGYNEASAPRMGDTVQNLSGVLDYKFAGNIASGSTWRVRSHIDNLNVFTSTAAGDSPNPRPATPGSITGNLKIASVNVLNFFTTLDDGSTRTAVGQSPRGADDLTSRTPSVTPATFEYDRQLAKLVNALELLDADIVGLVEIENAFDSTNDGSTAIEVLVNAINTRLGSSIYTYVDPGVAAVGTDAIAVGLIYKLAALQIAASSTPQILDDAVAAAIPALAGMDFTANPIFSRASTNRVPLAASFTHIASGEQFTVVVNHFKSKGPSGLSDTSSPNFDQLDGAAFWNQRRLDGATAVDAWLDTNPTGITDPDIVIMGDLNAYASEEPVEYLLSQGYNNVESQDAASFVFDGQTGTLDYILLSDSFNDKVTGATVWAINADEANAIDYNVDFGRDPSYFNSATATRYSDHDPVLVGLNLAIPAPPATANAGVNQEVVEGTTVTLDASASTGSETFLWSQVSGTTVTLSGANTASAQFEAPDVDMDGATLVFEVQAGNADGVTDTARVTITVTDTPQVTVAPIIPRPNRGCAMGEPGGPVDPILPAFVLLALLLINRRRFVW